MTLAAQFPYTADLLSFVDASFFPFTKWYMLSKSKLRSDSCGEQANELKGAF